MKKLNLNKNTIKNLKLQTSIKAGAPVDTRRCTIIQTTETVTCPTTSANC